MTSSSKQIHILYILVYPGFLGELPINQYENQQEIFAEKSKALRRTSKLDIFLFSTELEYVSEDFGIDP